MPVVGSSKNTTWGFPTKAIAVLNFLLFPPLEMVKDACYKYENLEDCLERALKIDTEKDQSKGVPERQKKPLLSLTTNVIKDSRFKKISDLDFW